MLSVFLVLVLVLVPILVLVLVLVLVVVFVVLVQQRRRRDVVEVGRRRQLLFLVILRLLLQRRQLAQAAVDRVLQPLLVLAQPLVNAVGVGELLQQHQRRRQVLAVLHISAPDRGVRRRLVRLALRAIRRDVRGAD